MCSSFNLLRRRIRNTSKDMSEDDGDSSDGSTSPTSAPLPAWTCQNCTNANAAGEAVCGHCAMYHLDARDAAPLVTRLGTEVSPSIAGELRGHSGHIGHIGHIPYIPDIPYIIIIIAL